MAAVSLEAKAHQRRHTAARKRIGGAAIAEIKVTAGCMDCPPGTVWPPEVLQFDHVRGVKRGPIAGMGGHAAVTVLDEIAKCEVVCANHHAMRTQARRS